MSTPESHLPHPTACRIFLMHLYFYSFFKNIFILGIRTNKHMLLEVCIFKIELAFYYLSLPIQKLINQTILSQDSGQAHFVPGSEHILLRSWQLTRHFSVTWCLWYFLRHENVINICDFFQGGVEKEPKGGGLGMGDRRITSSRPVWPILKNLRKILAT